MSQKKYLLTSALPYANGQLHFGHLAGAYLPSDVIRRHLRLLGHKVMHICGTDEHGVAIMISAKKEKMAYKDYVDRWHKEHKDFFRLYDIDFDFFGQTSHPDHAKEVTEWFKILYERGYLEERSEAQLYCSSCKNFLPDRFVEGTCYKCHYEKARGDECPNCGEWIEPEKLIRPKCQICGASEGIEVKEARQYYLLLSKYHSEYRKWLDTKKSWRNTIYPYLDSLSKEKLHDRAITRDLDWGIDVPLSAAKGKKFYVWFDAPIGYVTFTKQYLETLNSHDDYLKDWWQNPDITIVHFIGKDNVIFHGVIFPVMSMASSKAKPVDDLPANQYLNLEGKQFSKSNGPYIDALKAVEHLGSDALRYYLLSITPEYADSSFTWDGFINKVNGELANNIGNLVSRCLKFFKKNWEEGIVAKFFSGFSENALTQEISSLMKDYHKELEKYSIKKALEILMLIGQKSNTFFSDRAPWALVKTDEVEAKRVIAQTTMYIFLIAILFEPFLPKLSHSILSSFGEIPQELKMRIYQGDMGELEKFFSSGLKLGGEISILVPKVDLKLIESLGLLT